MSNPLQLVQFAPQNPSWKLSDLDNNFSQLNNALASVVQTGQFTMQASNALTGSILFNYTTIGNINWLWCKVGLTGPAQDVFLQLSGLPAFMIPSVGVFVSGGPVTNGGSNNALAAIFVTPSSGLVVIDCFQTTANGVQAGQATQGTFGLPNGFAFSFPTI